MHKSTFLTFYQLKRYLAGVMVLILLSAGIVFLIYSSPKPAPLSSSKINIVAAENFWGNIAAQIGGKYVQVRSLINDPTSDPHLYESSSQDAEALGSAKIVIMNGLGYDDFMQKLLLTSKSPSRHVLIVSQILGVANSNANPHLWYDIPQVPKLAQAISYSLTTQDPTHRLYYQNNFQKFTKNLQPLLNTLVNIKLHYSGVAVAYSERVPGYLLADAGLSVKTPPTFSSSVEDGTDPSPADTEIMDNLIATKKIKVFLYNLQATSPVTSDLRHRAQQANIPVVSVTETLPNNQLTYQSWQLDQLNALQYALQESNR